MVKNLGYSLPRLTIQQLTGNWYIIQGLSRDYMPLFPTENQEDNGPEMGKDWVH